jgi:hypothetical protein
VSRAAEGHIFEQTLREKEKNNPSFAFLFPGTPLFDYYQYILNQLRHRGPAATMDSLAQVTLPPEQIGRIQDMLQRLSGSQQSIIDGRALISDNFHGHEPSVAVLIRRYIEKEPDSNRRVFALYLISDILHAKFVVFFFMPQFFSFSCPACVGSWNPAEHP